MRRRRKNPITSDQIMLVLGGAIGGAFLYNLYQNQQANAANAAMGSNATQQLPAPQTSTQSGSQGPLTTNAQGPTQ